MSRIIGALAMAFSLLPMGAAVHAAPPSLPPIDDLSSRIRPKWVDAPYDVRKTLAELARCSVSHQPGRSLAMVLKPDAPLSRFERELVTPECLVFATWSIDEGPVALSIQPTVVRFAFADEIFRRDLTGSDAAALVSAAPLGQPAADATPYFAFGECIVRAAPVQSKALLSTKVETADEARAFVALLPAIERCNAPDVHLSLDKADVRGTVALNYVRLAAATGQLSSGGAK